MASNQLTPDVTCFFLGQNKFAIDHRDMSQSCYRKIEAEFWSMMKRYLKSTVLQFIQPLNYLFICTGLATHSREAMGENRSTDVKTKAYKWCKKSIGGAWARISEEELEIKPIRYIPIVKYWIKLYKHTYSKYVRGMGCIAQNVCKCLQFEVQMILDCWTCSIFHPVI